MDSNFSWLKVICLSALMLLAPASAIAAVKCGQVGTGAVALNGIGANAFGLTNGPYTCSDVDVFLGYFNPHYFDFKESSGGSISVGTTTQGYTATGFSSLGYNKIGLNAGSFAWADSEWADYQVIVGPAGSPSVSVTFTGHLDGRLTLHTNPSDIRDASVTYWLGVGNVGLTYQFNQANRVLNGGVATPRTSEQVSETFSFSLSIPVNTPFGIVGALSASVSNGGSVDFRNTAALERILVPSGYSVTAHGSALNFDGLGYIYASPVPEPSNLILMLCGICLFGACVSRNAMKSLGD